LKSSPWIRLLLALTALKLLGGVIGFALGEAPEVAGDTVLSPLLRCALLLSFAGGGLFLLTSGKNDERAFALGSFFFVLATAFSNRPLLSLVIEGPFFAWPALLLYVLAPDAFLPYLFWTFTQLFPNSLSSFKVQRLLTFGSRFAFWAGVLGFAWQIFTAVRHWMRTPAVKNLSDLAPEKPSYEYYGPLLLLVLLSFVLLLWRARAATGEEKQRSRFFVIGLVAGFAPLFLEIILEAAIPPYKDFITGGDRNGTLVRVLILPALATVLITTAYSVLVSHVLQVKLIARKAVQYGLAQTSALLLAVIPLAALVFYLIKHQDQTIEQIVTGSQLPLLAASVLAGVAALFYRKRLMDSIDRHFFREQYDARQILTQLVERSRAANSVSDLATLLGREVDLALHPESVSLMSFEPRLGVLADPKVRSRRLDASSSLATLIGSASDPLLVDLEDPRSPLAKLPENDRHWLVDSGFRLLVPILARDGSLLGLIGLGEKKSGLPFLKDDRQLLRAIANNAAWVLEMEQTRSMGSSNPSWQKPPDGTASPPFQDPAATGAELAKECPQCGRLYTSYTVFCTHCSRKLEPSHVPYVLPGKFRFERRIGIGGMGVVYRGSDLALGRPVAVKTLRRVSPEDAMRLRREARTAAAVSHPHLAPVYGMETWQGTPMLVMELLEGGTLAQRIEKGPLDPAETISLGIAMCESLEHLHASDILHRDIKPSNIGYTRDGAPKLMDFGIARVMFDLRRDLDAASADDPEEDSALPPTSLWNRPSSSVTMSKQLVGTLAYLSPEALNGESADTSFDLWSLAIVLYECLLGRRVFSGSDIHQLMARIRNSRVPEFSQVCPEHEKLLGEFFRAALHKTIGRRPASARELKERLVAARLRLAT
jgi:hypothetical protein